MFQFVFLFSAKKYVRGMNLRIKSRSRLRRRFKSGRNGWFGMSNTTRPTTSSHSSSSCSTVYLRRPCYSLHWLSRLLVGNILFYKKTRVATEACYSLFESVKKTYCTVLIFLRWWPQSKARLWLVEINKWMTNFNVKFRKFCGIKAWRPTACYWR